MPRAGAQELLPWQPTSAHWGSPCGDRRGLNERVKVDLRWRFRLVERTAARDLTSLTRQRRGNPTRGASHVRMLVAGVIAASTFRVPQEKHQEIERQRSSRMDFDSHQ